MSRRGPADASSGSSASVSPLVTGEDGWERRLFIGAGMVGACVLGLVAGVWARPHENGELVRLTAAREAYGPLPSQLQVVVEPDLRPPLEAPLQIAAGAEPVSVIPGVAPQVAAPAAPLVPTSAIVRVEHPAPSTSKPETSAPVVTPTAKAAPAEPSKPKAEPERVAKAEKTKSGTLKAEASERKSERAEKARLAKAEKAKPGKAAEDKAENARLAKLERKKAAAREKAEKAELAKNEAAEKKAAARLAWLAKVERMKAEEKATKAKLAKTEKPAPAKTASTVSPPKPAPAKPAVQLAATKPALGRPAAVNAPENTLDLQLAALRAEPLKISASAPVPAQKTSVAPKPTSAPAARTCQADSRAEELVCADPKLAAADRRLSAAYRRALQAGASPDRLRRQQGRWLAARAQAAEEAPWALADVYAVRTAELNDEADQARSEN